MLASHSVPNTSCTGQLAPAVYDRLRPAQAYDFRRIDGCSSCAITRGLLCKCWGHGCYIVNDSSTCCAQNTNPMADLTSLPCMPLTFDSLLKPEMQRLHRARTPAAVRYGWQARALAQNQVGQVAAICMSVSVRHKICVCELT